MSLTLKRLVRAGGQPGPCRCGFSENVFSRERVKPCFFVTFIITHIFLENFIELPQGVQQIKKFFSSIFIIFVIFLFTFPCCKTTKDVSL